MKNEMSAERFVKERESHSHITKSTVTVSDSKLHDEDFLKKQNVSRCGEIEEKLSSEFKESSASAFFFDLAHIQYDCQQDYNTNDTFLPIGINMHQIHTVINYGNDCDTNHCTTNRAAAAGKRCTS